MKRTTAQGAYGDVYCPECDQLVPRSALVGHMISDHNIKTDAELNDLFRRFGENPNTVEIMEMEGYNPLLIDNGSYFKWPSRIFFLTGIGCILTSSFHLLSIILFLGCSFFIKVSKMATRDIEKLLARDEQLRYRIMKLENQTKTNDGSHTEPA